MDSREYKAKRKKLAKLSAVDPDDTRLTFWIDRHTARVIKQRAKDASRRLPYYIAELVRRGLVK